MSSHARSFSASAAGRRPNPTLQPSAAALAGRTHQASYAPGRFRLPRRYLYLLFGGLALVLCWGVSRGDHQRVTGAWKGRGGRAPPQSVLDTVEMLAEDVLPTLEMKPSPKTFEDHYASPDEDLETKFVTGVPGYMLFEHLFAYQGVLYAVTASPLTFPDVSKIMSRNEHGPAGEDEWRVITPTQARHIFDDGGRVARLEGDTMLFVDGPPTSFVDHYYHFVVELFSGAWRVLSSTATEGSPLAPPTRVIFSRAPRWRDGPGLNSWFLQTVLPASHVEDKDGWKDRANSHRIYRFDRAVVVDRWASHRHNPGAGHWNKMNADVYDGVPAPADWWDPIRSQVMYALDIPDAPIANRPVVTYVDRQSVSKRRISEATHESLMQALYEVEEENIAQVYDAHMEQIPKREQFGLSSRTDILLGVHGNGLSHLLWMPRGSHIIEIFAPTGFTRDYEMLTKSLGHHHYAVWKDKVYLESEWKHASPHMETLASTGIDFQGTEIPIDGRFIKTLIKDIVEHNGVHYRRS